MTAIFFLTAALASENAKDGFRPIVTDSIVKTFDLIQLAPEHVSLEGDEIRLSGQTRGYLATKTLYDNFILRFEWRFELPEGTKAEAFDGNSGVFLRIKNPAKIWPKCVEYQLSPEDPGSLLGLQTSFNGETDAIAQTKASLPPGTWNHSEIEVRGTTIISRLNGQVISTGTILAGKGPIGLQSQSGAIRFRNLQVMEIGLKPTTPLNR
jgi:hypothetical protein